MHQPFVHLHLHSEFSLLDSTLRLKQLVERTKELGMPAVAVTDQFNMFALVKFYRAAVAAGIKPITGADVLISNPDDPDHASRLVLLCQNREGYLNLCALLSMGYQEGQYHGVPYLRRSWISEHSAGLIALSGGREGDVGQALINGHPNKARQFANAWITDFPDRFYLEIQRTGREQEKRYERHALHLAAELNLPVLASNDVRFLERDDFSAHEARVCIHDGRLLADKRREVRYSEEQYLKSPAEMAEVFADLPEALENTAELAKRCNLEMEFGKYYLPDFPTPDGESIEAFLKKDSLEGLARRLDTHGPAHDFTDDDYRDRLEFELKVINDMGFPGYFLIVADFIRWAKKNDIPVGPGRGSGAGSLVAYSLDITDLDPLQYDLLFERFLNPERISMPDFDVDFCMEKRDLVIDYVAETYGRDQVSQIITYGTMAAKAVVRDCGRVLGDGYGFVDSIAKLVPMELGITLEKALEQEPELKKRYDDEEDTRALLDLAMSLEGLTRNAGKHAGGVVIAPSALTDFTPLFSEPGGGNVVSQFDKDDVESIGLVKFDFLGLRTLTIVDWALKAINAQLSIEGKDPVILEGLSLDDPKTYQLLQDCRTTAVFQLESRGMKDLIHKLQPDDFNEIIALMALYRPGPLESGMVGDYVERKHGRSVVSYPHKDLEAILQPTYGVILYQEQVMQLDQTPFYAESGGQVGDTGSLTNGEETLKILDTKRENELILHFVDRLPNDPAGEWKAAVDAERRRLIKANHSATHLMHSALREVLGEHVEQRGSLVSERILRFDFSHFARLTPEEIRKVEDRVNEQITASIRLDERRDVPIEEAKVMGAMALFGEKYGDKVRVIIFDPAWSVELCGGTHVSNTNEIRYFKILSESSSAAGIRRIEAVTSDAALTYMDEQLELLKEVYALLKDPNDLLKSVTDLVEKNKSLEKELGKLAQEKVGDLKGELEKKAKSREGFVLLNEVVEVPSANDLKSLAFDLGKSLKSAVILLGANVNDKPLLNLMITQDVIDAAGLNAGQLIREVAKAIKGGGGGQPHFASAGGKDSAGLGEAVKRIEELV